MPTQPEEPGTAGGDDESWWYNTATRSVEHGRRSPWEHRMGPYATRAEAEAALETAARRNEDWESQDRD